MQIQPSVLAILLGIAGLLGRQTAPAPIRTTPAAPAIAPPTARIAPSNVAIAPELARAGADLETEPGVDVAELIASAARAADEQRRERDAIVGRVVDARTGEPMPGVTVLVVSPALDGERVAVTNDQGEFAILELPAGSYRATFYYREVALERDGIAVTGLDVTHLVQHLDPVSFSGTTTLENAYVIDESVSGM